MSNIVMRTATVCGVLQNTELNFNIDYARQVIEVVSLLIK